MITIVSLDKKSIQLSNKIIQLAKGLEPFDQNQDIIYQEIVTGDFLETFKLFYEEYQFDVEKMKFQKPLQTKDLEKCFTKNLADKIKPFIDIAIREKNFDIFIQFIQGAHLLQANHFIDFINCCIASAIQFKGSSDYDIKQFQKDWNLSDQQIESSFNQIFIQKLQNKYFQVLSAKEGDQPAQIQNQFEEDFFTGGDEW